jgi:FMNH2-dependent dimethyl sulfone monooxygenase
MNRPAGGRPGVSAPTLRGPFDPGGQPDLGPPNHLHLSLFAWNVSTGMSPSKVVLTDPDRYRDYWKWPLASRLITDAEAAGFDSQLQYGMWSGYGGETGWNDYQLDFVTAATASAAITSRLGIYSTVHVGYTFPPLMVAKMLASVDHISGGRLGVNIVAGQNSVDYAQFGLDGPPPPEVRYGIADEYATALKLLWTSDEPVDFEGEYFQMYGAQVLPRATSRPRPLLICAAGSGVGLDFATRQCDALFITAQNNNTDGFRDRARLIHEMAADHGRRVRIAAMTYVVMAETDTEAQEMLESIRLQIDREAIRTWLTRSGHVMNSEMSVLDEGTYGADRDEPVEDPFLGVGQEVYESIGLGQNAYHLVGSYESVALQMIDLYEAGVGQFALCFFDPLTGIQQMREHVIPFLRAKGYDQRVR